MRGRAVGCAVGFRSWLQGCETDFVGSCPEVYPICSPYSYLGAGRARPNDRDHDL